MDNIEIARQTLQLLLAQCKQSSGLKDKDEIEELGRKGIEALYEAEAEMKLLLAAHRTAMKALMHRLGAPG